MPANRFRSTILACGTIAVLAGVLVARAGEPPTPPATAARRGEVTILHTNDWHGYALPEHRAARGNRKAPPDRGGLLAALANVEKVRAEVGADRCLVLDAGDLLTGSPPSAIVEDGVTGGAFVKAWSGIGYDAWVAGNHDFDHGVKNLAGMIGLAKAPCLLANVLRAEDGKPALPAEGCKVFEKGGLKVGVVGCVTGDLARLASAETLAGLKIVPVADAAKPLVERLRKECDLVVCVTHEGLELDHALAKAVPGIDVIVAGHDHKTTQKPEVEGTTLIVEAGSNGHDVGRLDLVVEGGKVSSHRFAILSNTVAEGATPNATMAAPLARIQSYVDGLEHEVLGEVTRTLTRGQGAHYYYVEQLCGSFIADALRDAAKAEVGFMNTGGVRGELQQGKVTRADLLRVLPTDDGLFTFDATGAELEAILLFNAQAAVSEDHGILQVGGVRYRWKRDGAGKTAKASLVSVEVGGKPLDRAKTYRCASSSFVVDAQAKKYLGYEPKKAAVEGATLQSALIAALKKGPIEAPDRDRIVEEGAAAPAPRGGRSRAPSGGGDDKKGGGSGDGE